MAILRGGTRIFGQDIRIGIPRDKSLVNVAGDKRLKRRQDTLKCWFNYWSIYCKRRKCKSINVRRCCKTI